MTLSTIIPAFEDTPVTLTGLTSSLIEVQLINLSNDVLVNQYNQVLSGTSYLNLKYLFRNYLNEFTNFINKIGINSTYASTLGDNKHTTNFLKVRVIDGETITDSNQFKLLKSFELTKETSHWLMKPNSQDNIIRTAFSNQIIPLSIFEETVNSRTVTWDLSSVVLNTTNRFGLGAIVAPSITKTITANNQSFKLVIDNKCYERFETLYFLNSQGGWDWYNFIDYEDSVVAPRDVYQRVTDNFGTRENYQNVFDKYLQRTLFGRIGTEDAINYLTDLLSSPIVLDKNGIPVNILDDELTIAGPGLLQPQLTIEYKQQFINW